MKYNSYGALMILALALIVGAPMIQAQGRAKAYVPFEFSLEQSSMPAGTYEIGTMGNNVLAVRNLNTREARLVIEPMHKQSSQDADIPHSKLVFHKYDDQYFLAEVWDGQSNIGVAFPESNREKELKLARNTASQSEVVVIAMK